MGDGMEEGVPDALRKAALFQVGSGLANVLVMPLILSMAGGVCAAFTLGLGSVITLGSCLSIPIGLFEITAGILGLVQPDRSAGLMRAATWAEFVSLLGGSVHAAVVGYLVQTMLDDAEVQMYLEGPS